MALFNRLFNLDDVRGVRLHLDAPDHFTWSEGSLPLSLTFEGRGDEDLVAVELEVRLEQDRSEHERTFIRILPIRELVQPGQTVVRGYTVPMVLDDSLVDPSHEGQVPGWMSGLLRRHGMGSPGFTGRCELEVKVTYETAKRLRGGRSQAGALQDHRPR